MLLLREKAGELEIELRDDMTYSLRLGDSVSFANDQKIVKGRKTAYAFRSVEQLRYDFEREIADLAKDS
jgi:hypothetical protein